MISDGNCSVIPCKIAFIRFAPAIIIFGKAIVKAPKNATIIAVADSTTVGIRTNIAPVKAVINWNAATVNIGNPLAMPDIKPATICKAPEIIPGKAFAIAPKIPSNA